METKNEQEEVSIDDFFDKQPAAKPRIHTAPGDSKCVSCEG